MAVHPIFQLGAVLHLNDDGAPCGYHGWVCAAGLAKAPIPQTAALRQEQSFAEIAIYDQARCGTWGPLAIGARRAALRLISPSPQGDFESRHDRCDRDGTHNGGCRGGSRP